MLSISSKMRSMPILYLIHTMPEARLLTHDPPSPPAINANRIVGSNADTQTTAVVFTRCPPPVSPSVHSLALTPFRLDNKPCRATAVVLLFHELELRATSSLISSSNFSVATSDVAFAVSAVIAAALTRWLRCFGCWWRREQRVKFCCLNRQRSE